MKKDEIENYVWMTVIFIEYMNPFAFTSNDAKEANCPQLFIQLNTLEEVRANYENNITIGIRKDMNKRIVQCRNHFLPKEHLNEIKENNELILLVIFRLLINFNINNDEFIFNNYYLYVLYLIQVELLTKKELKQMQIINTINSTAIDYNNLKIKYTGLKNYLKNDNFIQWSFNYIYKFYAEDQTLKKFPIKHAVNTLETKKLYILTFFNIIHLTEMKDLFNSGKIINDLKKAWHQIEKRSIDKKYLVSNEISLTKKTKKALSELSNLKKMSEKKILEQLVEAALLKEKGK